MFNSKYQNSKPKEVELEKAACVLCDTDKFQEHIFDAEDKINGLEGLYGVDLCSTCGLYITNPRPTESSIGYYYPASYGPYQSSEVDKKKGSKKSVIFSLLLKLLNTKQVYLPKVKPGKLLEIGCASGSFLNQMKLDGWQVSGLEFSEDAVKKAVSNGLDVKQGSVLDHDERKDSFHMIAAWMVLEHIHNPVVALEKIHGWLKPNGALVFSIPNANSFDFKKLKQNSYGIHIPNHLYHFTPHTIKEVLKRQGFKNIKIHHQVTMASAIPSVGHYLEEKGFSSKLTRMLIAYPHSPRLLRLMFFPIAKLFAMVGQTGRMTIWAEK